MCVTKSFWPDVVVCCLLFWFCFHKMCEQCCVCAMFLLLLLNALDCFRPYFNDQSDGMNTLSEFADNAYENMLYNLAKFAKWTFIQLVQSKNSLKTFNSHMQMPTQFGYDTTDKVICWCCFIWVMRNEYRISAYNCWPHLNCVTYFSSIFLSLCLIFFSVQFSEEFTVYQTHHSITCESLECSYFTFVM